MPPVNLLIKPCSSVCDMDCAYCFYHDVAKNRERGSYGFMSEETLERVIKEALAYASSSCVIAFQGGEPTLRGLDFFKLAVELQKKYNVNGVTVKNSLQTNGYRLDAEFVKFLAANEFLTGVSIDGGRETHDAYRKNTSGDGTFFDVMETVGLFKKYRADYNVLTVVNARTGLKAKKLYSFYKKNGMDYLQFIPCLDPLYESPGSYAHSLAPDVYGAFLCELFDLWYFDYLQMTQPYIRQFENYIAILVGYGAESCDMTGVCGKQYVIEADGGVYPCDFYVLPENLLGNLNANTMTEIDEARDRLGFVEYSRMIRKKCRACEYYFICRGGCRRHRILPDGDGGFDNYFCGAYKTFFKHALERMTAMADVIKNRRGGS